MYMYVLHWLILGFSLLCGIFYRNLWKNRFIRRLDLPKIKVYMIIYIYISTCSSAVFFSAYLAHDERRLHQTHEPYCDIQALLMSLSSHHSNLWLSLNPGKPSLNVCHNSYSPLSESSKHALLDKSRSFNSSWLREVLALSQHSYFWWSLPCCLCSCHIIQVVLEVRQPLFCHRSVAG